MAFHCRHNSKEYAQILASPFHAGPESAISSGFEVTSEILFTYFRFFFHLDLRRVHGIGDSLKNCRGGGR
jgi:hypothetical protein